MLLLFTCSWFYFPLDVLRLQEHVKLKLAQTWTSVIKLLKNFKQNCMSLKYLQIMVIIELYFEIACLFMTFSIPVWTCIILTRKSVVTSLYVLRIYMYILLLISRHIQGVCVWTDSIFRRIGPSCAICCAWGRCAQYSSYVFEFL